MTTHKTNATKTSTSERGLLILGMRGIARESWFQAAKAKGLRLFAATEEPTFEPDYCDEILPFFPKYLNHLDEYVTAVNTAADCLSVHMAARA